MLLKRRPSLSKKSTVSVTLSASTVLSSVPLGLNSLIFLKKSKNAVIS